MNALALQADALGRDDERSSADLSSSPIPIPAMRPAALGGDTVTDATLETASIGPIDALPDGQTSALPTYSGFEPFAAAREASQKGADVIASLPMTASWEEPGSFETTSVVALMKWALHSPGEVIGMRAPRVSRRTVQHDPDAAASGGEIIPVATADRFDADRSASPLRPAHPWLGD